MVEIKHHGDKTWVYIKGSKEFAVTELRCLHCNSTVSVMTWYNKLTLKCKCRMGFIYPESLSEGRISIIPLKMHEERKYEDRT